MIPHRSDSIDETLSAIEPFIGGLIQALLAAVVLRLPSIEPLIGGLIQGLYSFGVAGFNPIEPLIGGLTYSCGNEQLAMSNE